MTAIYNIDYQATEGSPVRIVAVNGYDTALAAQEAATAVDAARLTVTAPDDLASLAGPVLQALWAFKAPKGEPMPEGEPALVDAIWGLLHPRPKQDTAEPEKNSGKKSSKKTKKGLQASASSGIEAGPESPGTDTETDMPKKTKKAAKKATAKKEANGLPREGSKAAKLLGLITRPGGATFAEMQKATGWKEMRGTALVLARKAGKTLKAVKDPEGKKATRWEAK